MDIYLYKEKNVTNYAIEDDIIKILLSTPPGQTTELWPPLGLLYIASSIQKQRNDDIKVIDAFCENLSQKELVQQIVKEEPDLIGLNCSTHTFLSAINTLQVVRKHLPNATLLLGGYHATFTAQQILQNYPYINYIIKGEAEYAFLQLLQCIETRKKPTKVDGISYFNNGRYVNNKLTLIENLDALPFPARDLAQKVDYGYYHRGIRLTFGKFTTINTSRGCPHECRYCSCAAFSLRKWRPRSAENVIDELQSLYDQGYENCVVIDDNFTLNRKRVEKICRQILSRRIRMQLYCEGRVDNASYSLLRLMKKAGFNVIYFGVESALKKTLQYYNKTITPEQTRKAVKNAKKAGMMVITSFIFGAPHETKTDIEQDIGFIRQLRPHGIQLNILDCVVGTPIWNGLVENKMVGPDDWKMNHRGHDYFTDGLTGEELEDFVDQGYAAYIDTWKSKAGVRDFFRFMFKNKTGRKIVLNNLFNPSVKTRLIHDMKFFEDEYRKYLY